MNSNGPKIDPRGTPVVIDKLREFVHQSLQTEFGLLGNF